MTRSDFSEALRKLIRSTGLPLRLFSQYTQLSSEDALRLWNNESVEVKLQHIKNLAARLGVAEESIVNSTYDVNLLRRRIFDSPFSLPEKYSAAALSYNRSSAHIIECIAILRGRHVADKLLQKLGVVPSYMEQLDKRISLKFFTDLLVEAKHIGIEDYELLSRAMFLTLDETALGEKFRRENTYEGFYSVLEASTHLFDENFDYKFFISRSGMDLICKPSENYLEKNSGHPMDSKELFAYRAKVFGCMPSLSRLPCLPLEVKRCLSQGDEYSHYSVRFPDLRHLKVAGLFGKEGNPNFLDAL